MGYDPSLNGQFDAVRDPSDAIVWAGKPHFFTYLFSGVPILIFGCLWGAFDYFGFIRHMPSSMSGFMIPFFALHLFPFWGAVLFMLKLLLSYHNTAYAVTQKQVIIRSGVFGIGYKSIDMRSISNLAVTVGPLESAVGAGSISFNYLAGAGTVNTRFGQISSSGATQSSALAGIDDPYTVYRQIHDASLAATTKAATAGRS